MFLFGSGTKPYTAVAVMRAVEAGQVDLSARAAPLINEVRTAKANHTHFQSAPPEVGQPRHPGSPKSTVPLALRRSCTSWSTAPREAAGVGQPDARLPELSGPLGGARLAMQRGEGRARPRPPDRAQGLRRLGSSATMGKLFGPRAWNITTEHLLHMSSGIADFDYPEFDNALLRAGTRPPLGTQTRKQY